MLPARGYLFMGLNAIRALSIIALILVFSSSIYVLVMDIKAVNAFEVAQRSSDTNTSDLLNCDYINGSTVPHQPAGIFWAVVNRLLIICQVIILILSELGWPSVFFERYFPVLGPDFGLGALGIFQCLIGATILSHHTDNFTLVSAFFLFSLGCLNMLLGLIFREKAKTKRAISSWREETKSILPTHTGSGSFDRSKLSPAPSFVSSNHFGAEKYSEFGAMSEKSGSPHKGYGFGRQGEKAAGLKGFLISKPVESLPRYVPKPTSRPPSADSESIYSAPPFKSSATAI